MSFHQARLTAAVPQTGFVFQQDMAKIGYYLTMHFGRAAGRPMALGTLYRMLQQQALLLSFIDIFRWTAMLASIGAVLGWLFRKLPHIGPAKREGMVPH